MEVPTPFIQESTTCSTLPLRPLSPVLIRRGLAQGARVRGSVDLPQRIGRHLGVDLRRGYRGVPQQFLDHPDVCTALKQVGGEGVPQGVR